jgi:hypothetical protein
MNNFCRLRLYFPLTNQRFDSRMNAAAYMPSNHIPDMEDSRYKIWKEEYYEKEQLEIMKDKFTES